MSDPAAVPARVSDRLERLRDALDCLALLLRDASDDSEAITRAWPDASASISAAIAEIDAALPSARRIENDLTILEIVFQGLEDGVAVVSPAGEFLFANDELCRLTAVERTQTIGSLLQSSPMLAGRDDLRSELLGHMARREIFQRELDVEREDGTILALELRMIPASGEGATPPDYWIATIRDVTRHRAELDEVRHQALNDALTGLPNWALVSDRLRQAIFVAKRRKEPVALLVLDLDEFHSINETYGYHIGDSLLQDVAERLRARVRATDTVGRVGGDEFAVVLPAVGNDSLAERIARSLREAIAVPIELAPNTEVRLTASIGIAMYPDHGDDVDTLLRLASSSIYMAKESEQGMFVYSALADPARGGVALARELREAIDEGALILHYQPKAHMKTGLVTRVEALVRWMHPDRGLVPPSQFISLAERTGLVTAMTAAIFDIALRQCNVWMEMGTPISVAVNLSAKTLQEDFLLDMIRGKLLHFGVDPGALKLEITESSMIADPTRAIEVLGEIRDLGIRLSLDDFGTGYSSLTHLRSLPVDEIKIDQSFVREMTKNENDAAIVHAMIDLAHNMGRQVVAEGCEDRATWRMLCDLGCDLVQGYFLSRPLPPSELDRWLVETRGGLALADPGRES